MTHNRILVVDDEPGMLELCRDILVRMDSEVAVEADPVRAATRLEMEQFDLAILDLRMPGMDGLSVLARARAANPHLSVLLMTAYPSDETVQRAVSLGATGYITKPFTPDQLRATAVRILLDRRLKSVSAAPLGTTFFEGMFGASEAMRKVFRTIEQVAPVDVDVLVTGESGTGKELVARALHARSPRVSKRFVPVDCGAIPETLIESELLGHEKGAYTGAVATGRGLLEFAHGGTLFLDEVAELPVALQAKLLRTLQEREFRRVGGTDHISVDLRVVAATQRDVNRELHDGRFRKDLFYRLNVVNLHIPPLRERKGDIQGLFDHFLRREGERFGRKTSEVEPAVRQALERYPWPGNVRELLNVVRRVLTLGGSDRVTVGDLPPLFWEGKADGAGIPTTFFDQRERLLRSFEKTCLAEFLSRHGGDVTAAAVEASLPRGTFYRLMRKYGLRSEDFHKT